MDATHSWNNILFQIWAGNDNCTVIYKHKCTYEEYKHTIEVKIPNCSVTGQIPFMTIVSSDDNAMVYQMKCHVKQKNVCASKQEIVCSNINYREWTITPEKECKDKFTWLPRQYIEHDRKCLFNKRYESKPEVMPYKPLN